MLKSLQDSSILAETGEEQNQSTVVEAKVRAPTPTSRPAWTRKQPQESALESGPAAKKVCLGVSRKKKTA